MKFFLFFLFLFFLENLRIARGQLKEDELMPKVMTSGGRTEVKEAIAHMSREAKVQTLEAMSNLLKQLNNPAVNSIDNDHLEILSLIYTIPPDTDEQTAVSMISPFINFQVDSIRQQAFLRLCDFQGPEVDLIMHNNIKENFEGLPPDLYPKMPIPKGEVEPRRRNVFILCVLGLLKSKTEKMQAEGIFYLNAYVKKYETDADGKDYMDGFKKFLYKNGVSSEVIEKSETEKKANDIEKHADRAVVSPSSVPSVPATTSKGEEAESHTAYRPYTLVVGGAALLLIYILIRWRIGKRNVKAK